MKEKIILCDRQAGFVSALERRLSGTLESSGIEVFAFDNVAKLLDSGEAEGSRVTLIGEKMLDAYQAEKLADQTERIVYLTEEKRHDGIFKYQSASDLTKQIVAMLLDQTGLPASDPSFQKREDRAQIIGFYSPVRPMIQSMLALTMGQILAEEKKVLYLNFEPYSGMEYLLQKEFGRGLSELLFYIRDRESRLSLRVETLTEKLGNLDYIPPVLAYHDLEEIEPDGFVRLTEKLATETDYEVILLDLSEVTGLFSVLESCDKIICPYADDPLASAKVDEYERMLDFMKYQTIRERTSPLRIPAFSRLPRQMAAMQKSELAQFIRREILKTGICAAG